MKRVDQLSVMYHGDKVGTLTMGPHDTCVFQYDRDWIQNGFSISPLKLPLTSETFEAEYLPFYGNFGIFEDSVPGGYGERMLYKALSKSGIDYYNLNPIQKLSIVGNSGMGALCYVPDTKIDILNTEMTLDKMQEAALLILSEKTEEGAGTLYSYSGNSGGVRPKALIHDQEGHWIVKFRHLGDIPEIGVVEYMYNVAAKECGIQVPEFKLMENRYFAEKRFDMMDGERIHVATASALLNEPINPPKMDYMTLLSLTGYLTQSPEAVEEQFRRMVFNYYAENYDDHARNFSFLYREGKWWLSPAYDMTHDKPLGQHATTVNCRSNPTDEDFVYVGMHTKMTREDCIRVIREVKDIARDLVKTVESRHYV